MAQKLCTQIEINEQFKKALCLLDGTRRNVFVTGKAGTGKSTQMPLMLAWAVTIHKARERRSTAR